MTVRSYAVRRVYADQLLRPWYDRLVQDLPGLELVDAHTHIGANDPDGYRLGYAELLAALEAVGAGAAVFAMHEPEGYPDANDHVLECATKSEGRLAAFCRVDPRYDAPSEARRCLDRGARGIKLHPRAERFSLLDPGLDQVFALADERHLPVLIHAGRGIPALGREALELCERHPHARLILAHAGVCDLGWVWRHAAEYPNLFFDTSWWKASDLLTLFSLVPPGQILYASDLPYGSPVQAAILCLRCGLEAGLSATQLHGVAGGQVRRLLAHAEPADLGPAPGRRYFVLDVLLERIGSLLVTAASRILIGDTGADYIHLARLACEAEHDPDLAAICASILALLDNAESRAQTSRPDLTSLQLVATAACIARTPSVALPEAAGLRPIEKTASG